MGDTINNPGGLVAAGQGSGTAQTWGSGQGSDPVVTDHELAEVRLLVESRSGILFDGSRERFFASRVREHVAAKRLAHGSDLLRVIKTSNVEYEAFLQRLLTQETSFFRYPDIFDALQKKVLPELHMRKFWENPRKLRIWSAGCATGEEPYSIAMVLADTLEFMDAWNVQILATDISRHALQHAERGVYAPSDIKNLTPKQVETHFARAGEQFMVKPRIRSLVSFAPLNLAQPMYVGRFDCIFCMNVLIYFSEARRSALVQRFHEYLEPGGFLFLGHAETVANAPVRFNTILHGDGRIYQKPSDITSVRPAPAGEVAQ
ncbi:MAG TPA: protein-glutamate O-methyltransferase CheR [Terriglobales bacterium]|nr:protein-glutamate O-methyltransferase CheR [Terriglobales bacterium]